jgi:hypothetical protein
MLREFGLANLAMFVYYSGRRVELIHKATICNKASSPAPGADIVKPHFLS